MKKVKKKRKKAEMPCDVPDCGREMGMGWGVQGKRFRICMYHFKRHCNESDEFSLFDALGLEKKMIGVDVDRFGIPIPPDAEEIKKELEKLEKKTATQKKTASLNRLQKWKETNKSERRRKPPPRPEVQERMNKEFDSTFNYILGG